MWVRWSSYLQQHCHTEAVVLAGIGLGLAAQISSSWLPTRDGAAYLSIARSIFSGDGPLRFGSPHLHFLPGYPTLIAPAFYVSDQPFLTISVIHWLFALALLAGCRAWFRRQMPEQALLLTALSALNVSVLYYFRRTLSEAAFMPLLLWTAVFMDRALDERRAGTRYFLAAMVSAVSLCAVRLAGVALACGFACMLLRDLRRGKIAHGHALSYAVLGVGLPFAAALFLVYYDRAMASFGAQSATYYDEFIRQTLPAHEQVLSSLRLRIQEIGRLLVPGAFKAYGGWWNPIMIIYLPICAAIVAGWWRMLRRQPSALLCAAPFYTGLYLIWPHDQGTRFMS